MTKVTQLKWNSSARLLDLLAAVEALISEGVLGASWAEVAAH